MSVFDKNKLYHAHLHTAPTNVDIGKYKPYSMLGNPRLYNLVDQCKQLDSKFENGIAVECGVANGGSLQIMREFLKKEIKVYGFDSWENMPPLTKEDENEQRAINGGFIRKNGKLVGMVCGELTKVQDGFKKNNISTENVHFVKGYFQDTIEKENLDNIILLRLDADWYEATYYLLDTLYSKVVKGGLVMIDDFYAFIGCRKAVVNFFTNNNIPLPTMYHTKEQDLNTLTGGVEVFWYKE